MGIRRFLFIPTHASTQPSPMTQLNKPVALPCPVCEAQVSLPGDVLQGEILACDDCGTELELTELAPLTLAEAPEVAEDWGD